MSAPWKPPLEREEILLAAFAMASRASRGRTHPEPEDGFRSAFQRDRDRIIHSTAFRRLEYKTQVFVNHEGDHYRTRLTHTLEVAQISRSIARALGLNEDLVEAIALSHDLGHPPFGHAGEEKLQELMAGRGGFNHNRHTLRVVDLLEQRYPGFAGLNLTWEVRESIVKHGGGSDHPDIDDFEPEWRPLVEAQLVDIGDSLAYDNHDIDDGLRSRYFAVEDLRGVELWRRAEEEVRGRWPGIDERRLVARAISGLINAQVQDIVGECRGRLAAEGIGSAMEARRSGRDLVGFSEGMEMMKREMQSFLNKRLYQHHRSRRMGEKGKRFIEAIFSEYQREPRQLPEEYQQRIPEEGSDRVICDYIAGMTDRFCQREHQ
ncbi:MAG: deoxyguanosinetriphosphate triphosphohydrolase, partial [Planctomycetota bacterium]